ncbi:amino acid/polyamine transporter I [Talaromyces proteolyticus]|uniref:Amino acid/polyamine transporter I n=1 Tax=Talaromyces proteolyticus TaxID=1131652 RepID=A0AAD4KJK3_9EURO|nr:amino acid/polyamine transporter I [Talaromyces proteolyticus]KAH8693796.1 amino acid/polyamine transporter I [Talaromyces proteolyticus]
MDLVAPREAEWFENTKEIVDHLPDRISADNEEARTSVLEAEKDYQSIDDAILRAQGHEATLKRSFSLLSSLGLAFDITNSWVGVLSNFSQNLKYGGPPLAVWSVLIAGFVQWIITLGLSEIASAFPSSGGQYHFVYIVAAPKYKRYAAFVTGWMSIFGWWLGTCSGLSLVSTAILGLGSFLHPEYVVTQWQVYLVYILLIVVTVIPLFVCPRWLPTLSTVALGLTVTGFITWFIVILSIRHHSNSVEIITRETQGTSGWNPGTAWTLGIINSMYAFAATDGATHIAEEMHRPGVTLPRIMNLTMAIGLVTAFPIIVVCMLSVKDTSDIMSAGWPALEMLYQISESKAVTVALSILLILIYTSNLPPQWIASGRLAWAFARDNGLPYSKYFSHIDPVLQFPVRTTVAACIFSSIYGLIYLASTTAFNSIITSAILFLNISYAIPQAIVAVRGRSKTLVNRPLNLGRWGYICNIFAPLWIVVMCVLVCFPPSLPVTLGSMNYSAPVIVALFAVIVVCWVFTGKQFECPAIDIELLNARNTK